MTRRAMCVLVFVLLAMLCASGCGRGGEPAAALPEIDEPAFRRAQQFARQGNKPEALASFLKVIDQRGEAGAPESHLEAGLIYERYDPIEAIHHFKKYLELQPNSRQSELVRQRIEAATRELARSLPGRPLENQSARLEAAEEIERLRRENADLRAENLTLRGSAAMTPRSDRGLAFNPPAVAVPSSSNNPSAPVIAVPSEAAPAVQSAPVVAPRPAPASAPATPTMRTHRVGSKDSLWAISRLYYGTATNETVKRIRDANPGVDTSTLHEGDVLKIP
jgi:tetratricopeptide (TPR) repeat protein